MINLADELNAATVKGKIAAAKQVFLSDEETNVEDAINETRNAIGLTSESIIKQVDALGDRVSEGEARDNSMFRKITELEERDNGIDRRIDNINETVSDHSTEINKLTTNKVDISAIEDMATKTWVGQQGFLTEHQSLDNYYTKEEVDEIIEDIDVTEQLKDYAKVDGTYPDMTVGTAINLEGTTEISNNSAYHPTGGNEDVQFGTASIQSIQGNSVAWNQVFPDDCWGNVNKNNVEISCNDYKYTIKVTEDVGSSETTNISSTTKFNNYIINHIYYFKVIGDDIIRFRTSQGSFSSGLHTFNAVNDLHVRIKSNTKIGTYNLYIFAFDLTLIYGAGKEPTTVEQFESDYQRWFGHQLEYEEYDEGSIRTTLATGIKTVGFNLYGGGDFEGTVKEWYENYLTDKKLWENNYGYQGQVRVSFDFTAIEDVEGSFISPGVSFYYTDGTWKNTPNYATERVDVISDVGKIVKYIRPWYHYNGTIKITNLCINFSWSGKRDGEYEPYWEDITNLPITTVTGKLNGEGESVIVFPDGMKRAGTVYDEIKVENGVTKAIKRIGSVDLGSLSWSYQSDNVRFRSSQIPSIKNTADNKAYVNGKGCELLSYRYNNIYVNTNVDKDKTISETNGFTIIRDNSFNGDVTTFKQSLQGVILYYELEEPQEYILNTELPIVYKIDDFGTEQIIQPSNSIAPTINTTYGVNAVDTVRRLPKTYVATFEQEFTDEQKRIARQNIGVKDVDLSTINNRLDEVEQHLVPTNGKDGQVLMSKDGKGIWADFDILDLVSYGVEWDTNVADPTLTRIGNMNYHKTLPIQSGIRGCIYNPIEKKVVYWLNKNDWRLREDPVETTIGNIASEMTFLYLDKKVMQLTEQKEDNPNYYKDRYVVINNNLWQCIRGEAGGGYVVYEFEYLGVENWETVKSNITTDTIVELHTTFNGYDGEVMNYVPEFYIKSWDGEPIKQVRISTTKIDDTWEHQPAVFLSAYRATVLNSTVENMGYLSTLEANSSVSIANNSEYCRGGNGTTNYDESDDEYRYTLGKCKTAVSRAIFRNYSRKAGKEIMSYRQYKNIIYWLWVIEYATFNSQATYNSELTSEGYQQGGMGPGLTNMGNWTEYNATNPIAPNGYTNEYGNQTVVKDLIIPSFTYGEENTLRAQQTLKSTRWRGFEDIFGHIYHNVDGIIINSSSIEKNGTFYSEVYSTDNPNLYSDSDYQSMEKVGIELNEGSVYIKEFDLGSTAEIIPKLNGASSTTYKCAYHYVDQSKSLRTLLLGGSSDNGGAAGVGCFHSNNGVGDSSVYVGFRVSCVV